MQPARGMSWHLPYSFSIGERHLSRLTESEIKVFEVVSPAWLKKIGVVWFFFPWLV